MTTFHGTSGQDVFYGTTGDDTFVMTADNFVTDLIYDWGFGVNDTVDYTPSAVGVSITLNDSAGWSPPTGTVSAVFPMNIYDPGTHAYMQIDRASPGSRPAQRDRECDRQHIRRCAHRQFLRQCPQWRSG